MKCPKCGATPELVEAFTGWTEAESRAGMTRLSIS